MKKKKMRLTMKLYMVISILMILFFVLSSAAIIKIVLDREDETAQMVSDNSLQLSANLVDYYLNNIHQKVAGVDFAEKLYKEKLNSDQMSYRKYASSLIDSIYSELPDGCAVCYVDDDLFTYSIGPNNMGDYQYRRKLIEECESDKQFSGNKYLWKYVNLENNQKTIMLCRKIVYLSDQYTMSNVATIMVFIDAESLRKVCLANINNSTGVIFVDHNDMVTLANDSTLVGQKVSDLYKLNGNTLQYNGKSYNMKAQMLEETDLQDVCYIKSRTIWEKLYGSMIVLAVFMLVGIFILLFIYFYVVKAIDEPINDLFRTVSVSKDGNVSVEMNETYSDEMSEIKHQFIDMSQMLKNQMKDNYEMQLRYNEMRLRAYENQMNPHFMFNTLQIMQMMHLMGEDDNVSDITGKLAKILRFNLDKRKQVKFREEIENAICYCEIIKYRYKGSFNYRFMISEKMMDMYVIKFLVQPIIENSIKYGFIDEQNNCEVVISEVCLNDEIAIVIKDNGVGIEPDKLEELKQNLKNRTDNNAGIGLANINERLRLVYGEQYGIDIFSQPGRGTQVMIHMPIVMSKDEDRGSDHV